VLPDYKDDAYYLQDNDNTRNTEDVETGQNRRCEPYHTKISGMSIWCNC